MLKIIHAADLHLDSPFHGLSAAQAVARRQAQREVLIRLMELCEEEQADLLLLAGDLFDGNQVYPETLDALTAALGRSSLPIFIAPGNHDPIGAHSPYLSHRFPSNVHIFSTFELQRVALEQVVVYGNAFLSPLERRAPLQGFHAEEDARYQVAVVHGDVGKASSDYAPIAHADIEASGLDYLALGHVHRRSEPQTLGDTTWAYAGCPEGRGFDELGEKGCYVVTLDEHGAHTRFVPLAQHRYLIFTAQGDETRPWNSLLDELFAQIQEQDDVRILLRGEISDNRPDLRALELLYQHRCASLSLRDETTFARDIWARAQEDTLTGLYLSRMKALWDKADEPERQALTLSLRYGLAALEGGEEPMP